MSERGGAPEPEPEPSAPPAFGLPEHARERSPAVLKHMLRRIPHEWRYDSGAEGLRRYVRGGARKGVCDSFGLRASSAPAAAQSVDQLCVL